MVEVWVQNPYCQAFCGLEHFQWRFPCDPSDLVHFRKRIGESSVEKILQVSISIHGDQAHEDEVIVDTTVQEKNINFQTDTKLRMKVIKRCWHIASEENIVLRRSYLRELRKVLRTIRFGKIERKKSKVAAAKRRVKTMQSA